MARPSFEAGPGSSGSRGGYPGGGHVVLVRQDANLGVVIRIEADDKARRLLVTFGSAHVIHSGELFTTSAFPGITGKWFVRL